jgi:hypothetical protein
VGHIGGGDVAPAVVDDPLLAAAEVADHDVHVDPVAAVGGVDDRGLCDVEQRVHVRLVAHDRSKALKADGVRRRLGEVEQRELVVLVAALVVLDDDRPTARHVASDAARRESGQRESRTVRGDLDELLAAEVVMSGQHPAGHVEVEGHPGTGVEQQAEEFRGGGHRSEARRRVDDRASAR